MEEKNKISEEEIAHFIEGRNEQERIVNLSYNNRETFISVFYRNKNDQKCISKEPFYPFCWATENACKKLCYGNKEELKKLLKQFKIGVTKLSNINYKGEVCHEFDDGYMYKFFAKEPMSYYDFLRFFKIAKNPIYSDDKSEDYRNSAQGKQYLMAPPQEQFLISTGKRFFKGYEDYDDLLRMTFDLETTGLDTDKDRITHIGIRFNRPFNKRPKGFEHIFNVYGETEEEKDASERFAIEQFIKVIKAFGPDIITAHKGETFDWVMLIGACKRLGISMEDISSKYFDGETIHKHNKESILKLGGEIEKFYPTIVPNTIVTDSLHAVRRAQALDSSMLKADLKYITEYSKMKKENRVYIPGDKISSTAEDNDFQYAFNNTNGDWYKYDPSLNEEEKTLSKSTKTKKSFIPVHGYIKEGYELVSGAYIVERYLLDDLWECDKVEHRYNTSNFLICKMLPVPYKKCTTMGTAGQWKSLFLAWSYENNLAIPMFGKKRPFVGGISRILSVGFNPNVIKLDYNSLYPSATLTWGVNGNKDLLNAMLLFLEYFLNQREKYKKLKKKAGNEKDKYKELINEANKEIEDLENIVSLMKQFASEEAKNDKKQLPFKIFCNSYFGSLSAPQVFPWGDIGLGERITCIGRQSLRLMISHFSNMGGKGSDYNYKPLVGDTDGFNFQLPKKYRYTEENPYISSGESRETQKDKAYVNFYADLAEFNDTYMRDFKYTPNAIQKMGLGLDEVVSSTINFSRKNYADYFPENPYPEDVKLVGNTIKSKKMPAYIAKFLDKGVRYLLQEKGQDFINEYYNYIENIFNYKISFQDIASKGKIKVSLEEYIEDKKNLTKAGRPKSRQAWYELAIKNNLTVNPGDTIYYINTGTKKSHSDIKKVTHYLTFGMLNEKVDITKDVEKGWRAFNKEYKKDPTIIQKLTSYTGESDVNINDYINEYFPNVIKEEEVIMNCFLLPRESIDSEEEVFCSDMNGIEYNVEKYIDQFNKRIKPLLVCFSKEIRNEILINNPKDRKYFTDEQCKLVSGEPNNPQDQDTYEQLMTMSDGEYKHWCDYDAIPPFFEESGMGVWEEKKKEFLDRIKREKEMGITAEKEEYQKILTKLSKEDIENFTEDGEIPTSLLKIIDIDPLTNYFMSKKFENTIIGSIDDLLDIEDYLNNIDDEDEINDNI